MKANILYAIILSFSGYEASSQTILLDTVNRQFLTVFRNILLRNDTIFLEMDSVVSITGNDMEGVVISSINGHKKIVTYSQGEKKNKIVYNPNGKKAVVENYANGKRNGEYCWWNEDGSIFQHGYFKHDIMDSTWTFYYSNGVKESEGNFFADTTNLFEGFEILQSKRDEGTTGILSMLPKSPPNGTWQFYNQKGDIIKTIEFEKGRIKFISVGDHP